MTYKEEITWLALALRAQGFNIDEISTEQFLKTSTMLKVKKNTMNIEDTAKLQAEFEALREEKSKAAS